MSDVLDLSPLIDGATHVLCQLECTTELFNDVVKWAKDPHLTTVLNPALASPLSDGSTSLHTSSHPTRPSSASSQASTSPREWSLSEQEVIHRGPNASRQGVSEMVVTLGARGALHVTPSDYTSFGPYPVRALTRPELARPQWWLTCRPRRRSPDGHGNRSRHAGGHLLRHASWCDRWPCDPPAAGPRDSRPCKRLMRTTTSEVAL